MGMTKRTYYLDDETIAFLEDAASRGWSKSQALRRACKAGIDVVCSEGLDSLPPDKQRKYRERALDDRNGEAVGENGVGGDEGGGSRDRRPVPDADAALGADSNSEAHDEDSTEGEGTGTSGRSSEGGIFKNLFRS